MNAPAVSFSIAAHSAWAPGLDTPALWQAWSAAPAPIAGETEPRAGAVPPMLRRRAGQFGKMALETASAALGEGAGIPVVFSSRHGDVARAVELLTQLAHGEALSPTAFGMAVHNATAGLLSIARGERAVHMALAAGASSLEHAVIEACALLADGAPRVLLVAVDCPLPGVFAGFEDCVEQPHAFAWLLEPARADASDSAAVTLSWQVAADAPPSDGPPAGRMPGGLDVLRFHLAGEPQLVRRAGRHTWCWSRHG
jgi:hypothetical protein